MKQIILTLQELLNHYPKRMAKVYHIYWHLAMIIGRKEAAQQQGSRNYEQGRIVCKSLACYYLR